MTPQALWFAVATVAVIGSLWSGGLDSALVTMATAWFLRHLV